MQESLFPLLLAMAVSVILAATVLGLSALLGPKRPSVIKGQPFESGNEVEPPTSERFHVKFYLVAILFLVFDIETVFVYPWALAFAKLFKQQSTSQALQALGTLALFLLTVAVGLVYAWRKGALDWSKQRSAGQALAPGLLAKEREVAWKNTSV